MWEALLLFWTPGFRCTHNATILTQFAREVDTLVYALTLRSNSDHSGLLLVSDYGKDRNGVFLLDRVDLSL